MKQILLLLFLSIAFNGCKKEMPEPPTEVTSNSSGWGTQFNEYNVSFYTAGNGSGPITISLNGSTAVITYYYNYNPGCRDPGCANFTIPPGTYMYTAGSGSTIRTGTLTTGASQCITIRI